MDMNLILGVLLLVGLYYLIYKVLVFVFRKFKTSIRAIPMGNPDTKATVGDAYDMLTMGHQKMVERDIKNDPEAMAAIGRYWEHMNNFRTGHAAFMQKMHDQYGIEIPDRIVRKKNEVADVV